MTIIPGKSSSSDGPNKTLAATNFKMIWKCKQWQAQGLISTGTDIDRD
jgi:hypothetical protein